MSRLSFAAASVTIFLIGSLCGGCGKGGSSGGGGATSTAAAKTVAAPATPEAFATHLFNALVKNDVESFKQHYQQDLSQIKPVFEYWANSGIPTDQPLPATNIDDDINSQYLAGTVRALPKLREKGQELGIDWSKVTNVQPVAAVPDDARRPSYTDCQISFESAGKKFKLNVGDVKKVGDKWFTSPARLVAAN